MTAPRDTDRLIRAFLEEGRDELPDRAFDAVRARIDHTRQRVVIAPWREEQVSRYAMLAIAAAAIVIVAVVGIRFLPGGGGIGGPPAPTPTPTPTPTAAPTASPTPVADPGGPLTAGTYVAHPFGPPNRSMSFTFSVPSASWEAAGGPGQMIGISWAGDSQGVGLGFLRVTSLNNDPCKWDGTWDDVAIGPTVDDLVSALAAQTEYDASEPSDVTLSSYSGKKVVVTMPGIDVLGPGGPPACYPQAFQIWNAEGFDIYAQGPENRWTLSILDVEGERVVINASDFEDKIAGETLQELQSIVDSIVITAP